MSVDTAAADRLPWLADEPEPQPASKRRRVRLLSWAAGTVILVAAAGFWLGERSVEQSSVPTAHHVNPSATVRLPPPKQLVAPEVSLPAQPVVRQTAMPEVRPAPVREVRIAPPPVRKPETQAVANPAAMDNSATSKPQPATATPPAPATAVAQASASEQPFVMPKPWNPRVFAGAAGRLVQVGAFGSVTQAKHGWWFMVREYPAMAHLPAVVRPTRNSKGRVFYRFQVGTTSQAHSEVLCQRMQKIRFSCAVVGLPWKAKVER